MAGWVIDQEGNALTSAKDCLDGFGKETAALLPLGGIGEDMGGHKGYGLGAMVEIFCSQLATNPWSDELARSHGEGDAGANGQMFMAWRVDAFRDVQDFKDALSAMCIELRAMDPLDPAIPVLVPGDPEMAATRINMEQGVPIRKPVFDELQILAEQLGAAWL